MLGSRFGYTEIVILLLKHCPDIYIVGNSERNALKWASIHGHNDIVNHINAHECI